MKSEVVKAIHINYFDDSESKPEVILDGEFSVKDINLVHKLVMKQFEVYRRDRIVEAKRKEREILKEEEEESDE